MLVEYYRQLQAMYVMNYIAIAWSFSLKETRGGFLSKLVGSSGRRCWFKALTVAMQKFALPCSTVLEMPGTFNIHDLWTPKTRRVSEQSNFSSTPQFTSWHFISHFRLQWSKLVYFFATEVRRWIPWSFCRTRQGLRRSAIEGHGVQTFSVWKVVCFAMLCLPQHKV